MNNTLKPFRHYLNELWKWKESDHPRYPKNHPLGGRFRKKVNYDTINKVVRGRSLGSWGYSHGGSQAITWEAAKMMGIEGYKQGMSDSTLVHAAIKLLSTIYRSPGSMEKLYHGFQNVRNTEWKIGDTIKIPLTATSGDIDTSSSYGTRFKPEENNGPATVFEFVKGTPIAGYSRWKKEDAEYFGHTWGEALVAGEFEITKIREGKSYAYYWRDTPYTVVTLKPKRLFDPYSNEWKKVK